MPKDTLTLEQFKLLCDYNQKDNCYIAKQGQDYINALAGVVKIINKNDFPFTIDDIKKQPLLNQFKYEGKNEFNYTCELIATPLKIENNIRKNEKIIPINFASDDSKIVFHSALGVAYLITFVLDDNEYIIKIGQSRTSFNKRLQSYNCGTVNNWRTASTTNIKLLQSMAMIRKPFKLYLCDCSTDPYVLDWHGKTSVAFASPKSLAVEDIMVKEFIKQFGKKPLANIQANATELN